MTTLLSTKSGRWLCRMVRMRWRASILDRIACDLTSRSLRSAFSNEAYGEYSVGHAPLRPERLRRQLAQGAEDEEGVLDVEVVGAEDGLQVLGHSIR